MPTTQSSYSYAVFRFVKDARRDISVPIGVALWSEDANWVKVRLVRPNEKVRRVSKTTDYPFINIFGKKLSEWLASTHLPYAQSSETPTADAWWKHLQTILIHKIRISDPRPIDCLSPDSELETLFNEVVGNAQDADTTVRIDHLISHCLGTTLSRTLRRGEITGYSGKPVHVMRFFSGTQATVVLEGVNLGLENAATEADALVGKLQRVRANGSAHPTGDRSVIAIVGYVASPDGLNGEGFLKDWIEEAGDATALDVEREPDQLRAATERAIQEAGPPPALR
jgi:hypothetical protein